MPRDILKPKIVEQDAPRTYPLSIQEWLDADISAPDFLLGEVFHTQSRAYIIGPTGLGKTNFGMAMAFAMAAGKDFLHWEGQRPCKILYIDGEMSPRLMKQRIKDCVRRHGGVPDGLQIINRATVGEDFKALNTKEGQDFINTLLQDVSLVIFDNLMSLADGSLRDEEVFASLKKWIASLSSKSIGQIWLHHTGIDESRGYGDKSKEWTFDTVLLMKKVKDDDGANDTDIVLDLEFTKARERTPDNRGNYQPARIRLENDVWKVEGIAPPPKGTKKGKPSPGAEKFFTEFCNAINADDAKNATITKERWKKECLYRGLISTEPHKDGTKYVKSDVTLFNQYVRELVTAGRIVVDGEMVRLYKK
jgi:hypothetical protein